MKQAIPAFVFLLLLIGSCKKDPPLQNQPPVTPHDTIRIADTIELHFHPLQAPRPAWPMVKTISYMYNGNLRTDYYYYDSLWRLKSINNVGNYTYTSYAVYSGSSTYYLLGSNGLATQNNSGSWYSDEHYSYNSYPNQTGYYKGSGTASYTYDNDHNMSYRHTSTEANPFGYIYNDDYYIYNTHLNTIGNYNTGQYYLGKSSVNLVERVDGTTTNWTNVPSTSFIVYNYTYNDSGWVASRESNSMYIHTVPVDSVTVHSDTTYGYSKYDYTYY